jgi:hypothetical protein
MISELAPTKTITLVGLTGLSVGRLMISELTPTETRL